MNRRNKLLLTSLAVFCSVALPFSVSAATGRITITADQWSRVSSAGDFITIEGLPALILQLNEFPASVLVVHYRGGETGQFKAQQFRNRLVAAGVEKSRVQLVQGVPDDAELVVGLQDNK